ncbi:phospholipase D family protein [Hyalangium gracile]|uniref:phospholipase D family protein n=1 Tax=Hyalangium gracile TaxID=394092 RepID=UPI001CCBDF87|nr:phospholipase D family protein [Hyalangium gracile]
MALGRRDTLALLDAIRPEPGQEVQWALFATYSAELVALVAMLLALAGLDDEDASGSKVDLARSIEHLRGRVRFLAQAGRVVPPSRHPRVLGLLDQFVREIPFDERRAAWHPKLALVRLGAAQGEAEWRLWVGSRNLTRDLSWDTGLLLVGHPGGAGVEIAGVPEAGEHLATRAALPGLDPETVQRELTQVRWKLPEGVLALPELRLHTGAARSLPSAPMGLRSLTIVSPFLSQGVLSTLSSWGDASTHRTLVSTLPALQKLPPVLRATLGFAQVAHLDVPAHEEAVPTKGADSESEEQPPNRGLHGKVIHAVHQGGQTLWLGSANTTERGWKGPNAEVIARLEVASSLGDSLLDFIGMARPVAWKDLPELPAEDPDERALEEARAEVSSGWKVLQRRDPRGVVLIGGPAPHPQDASIELEVGLLGGDGVLWPRGTEELRLPSVGLLAETEWIKVLLRRNQRTCSWVQRAPLDPPPDEERDRRLLAAYLGPRAFLLWVRSTLLEGDTLDGGGAWDEEHRPAPASHGRSRDAALVQWAPSLELVLRSWARQGDVAIRRADALVQRYLSLVEKSSEPVSPEEQQVLHQFAASWSGMVVGLLGGACSN